MRVISKKSKTYTVDISNNIAMRKALHIEANDKSKRFLKAFRRWLYINHTDGVKEGYVSLNPLIECLNEYLEFRNEKGSITTEPEYKLKALVAEVFNGDSYKIRYSQNKGNMYCILTLPNGRDVITNDINKTRAKHSAIVKAHTLIVGAKAKAKQQLKEEKDD